MSKTRGPFCNQTVNLKTKSRSLFCLPPTPKVHKCLNFPSTLLAIEQWRGRGEKEFHSPPLPSPINLPFLLLPLQLSLNNSTGNVCYTDYGFFNKSTMVHTQILGTKNKDFVSSLHTDLTRGLVSSVAQATVQLLSHVTSKNPLKACTSS